MEEGEKVYSERRARHGWRKGDAHMTFSGYMVWAREMEAKHAPRVGDVKSTVCNIS
jgi:hypothetical protein